MACGRNSSKNAAATSVQLVVSSSNPLVLRPDKPCFAPLINKVETYSWNGSVGGSDTGQGRFNNEESLVDTVSIGVFLFRIPCTGANILGTPLYVPKSLLRFLPRSSSSSSTTCLSKNRQQDHSAGILSLEPASSKLVVDNISSSNQQEADLSARHLATNTGCPPLLAPCHDAPGSSTSEKICPAPPRQQRRVTFDPSRNQVYKDEIRNKLRRDNGTNDNMGEKCTWNDHETWYTNSETSRFKHQTIQLIRKIRRYDSCFVNRLQSIYETCNLTDLQESDDHDDKSSRCCDDENCTASSSQTTHSCVMERLYEGTPHKFERIGLEKHVCQPISMDCDERRQSLHVAVEVIQSSVQPSTIDEADTSSRGMDPLDLSCRFHQESIPFSSYSRRRRGYPHYDDIAEEIRESSLRYTFLSSIFAQILAKAQFAAEY